MSPLTFLQDGNPSLPDDATSVAMAYINGRWTKASGDQTFESLNPTTRQKWAEIAECSVSDLNTAISAAEVAQINWSAMPPAARSSYLIKAAEIFEGKQEAYVSALIEETGSGFGKAMFECSLVPLALREAASLSTHPLGEIYPSNIPGKSNRVERHPLGVIGVISPWNFPLYLSLRGFVYALALGNTAVLKPSEDSPITGGTMLAEIFDIAGLPPGVLNVVPTSREHADEMGEIFCSDSRIKTISFTGSTKVGSQLAVACALAGKPILLEMGGKNPVVVLEDADLEYSVNLAFFSSYLHQGQICMSSDKLIVAEDLFDRFVEKLTKKISHFKPLAPSEQTSVIGPIINDKQLERIDHLVKSAIELGAKLHIGGSTQGPFYQATLLTNVTPEMDIYHEEIFGPVAFVVSAKDEHQAIKTANDTQYGLTASVVTGDAKRGEIIAGLIDAGMVHVNDSCVHDEPHCPFGGMKFSGWSGRWGASGAIAAFTQQKWISSQSGLREYPF